MTGGEEGSSARSPLNEMIRHDDMDDILGPTALHVATNAIRIFWMGGACRQLRAVTALTRLNSANAFGLCMGVMASGTREVSGAHQKALGLAEPVRLRGNLKLVIPTRSFCMIKVERMRFQWFTGPVRERAAIPANY
jgi:hypothetical protein